MHRYTELASFISTSNLSEVCHFHLRNSELYEQRCVNTNIVRDNNHCPRHSEYLRCCHTCVRINASGAEFSVSLAQGYVEFTMHILVTLTPTLMVTLLFDIWVRSWVASFTFFVVLSFRYSSLVKFPVAEIWSKQQTKAEVDCRVHAQSYRVEVWHFPPSRSNIISYLYS